jgi:hypothetical protein
MDRLVTAADDSAAALRDLMWLGDPKKSQRLKSDVTDFMIPIRNGFGTRCSMLWDFRSSILYRDKSARGVLSSVIAVFLALSISGVPRLI